MIECNGQTISAEDYPELVQILGTNIVPNLNGRVLQGSNTPNTFISAGLPNITGNILVCKYADNTPMLRDEGTGAFSRPDNTAGVTHGWGTEWRSNVTTTPSNFTFNASKSNSIYGNSTTVQPPAYTVKYYICYQS